MIEYLSKPWEWYVVGPLITIVMLSMFYFGKTFGVSSNFRTICALGGAGKVADFFKFDWKSQIWNLVFVGGTIIGGFIAKNYFMNYDTIAISAETVAELKTFGIETENQGLAPLGIFSWENLFTTRTIIMLVLGGFFVGFGTRYAGGCTSGHAITGLSNLQIPSLIAVVGFFIGGLIMTWGILPYILSL